MAPGCMLPAMLLPLGAIESLTERCWHAAVFVREPFAHPGCCRPHAGQTECQQAHGRLHSVVCHEAVDRCWSPLLQVLSLCRPRVLPLTSWPPRRPAATWLTGRPSAWCNPSLPGPVRCPLPASRSSRRQPGRQRVVQASPLTQQSYSRNRGLPSHRHHLRAPETLSSERSRGGAAVVATRAGRGGPKGPALRACRCVRLLTSYMCLRSAFSASWHLEGLCTCRHQASAMHLACLPGSTHRYRVLGL